jgi:hypothetical protein
MGLKLPVSLVFYENLRMSLESINFNISCFRTDSLTTSKMAEF